LNISTTILVQSFLLSIKIKIQRFKVLGARLGDAVGEPKHDTKETRPPNDKSAVL
jgi:hypothetical protein